MFETNKLSDSHPGLKKLKPTKLYPPVVSNISKIQRKQACACGGTCPKCQAEQLLQPKLVIGSPDDKYEQEADRVADQVMRSSLNSSQEAIDDKDKIQAKLNNNILQRQPEEDEEENENLAIQTKLNNSSVGTAGTQIQNRIKSLRGGGERMSNPSLNFFGSKMGYNFGDVRIHKTSEAESLASQLNARAFTTGKDIVFGQGQFSPDSNTGKRLLAHELTHVAQQGAASVKSPEPAMTNFHSVQKQGYKSIQRQATPAQSGSNLGLAANMNFRGCSNQQDFILETALIRARRWTGRTLADMGQQPSNGTITTTESALLRFFPPPPARRGRIGGVLNQRRRDIVRRRLQRILNALNRGNNSINCVSRGRCGRENSDHSPDALAYAGQGTRISVCPNFFVSATHGQNKQVSTLIHEAAHVAGLMRNVIPRDRVMSLSYSRAITNAESYALFVTENIIGAPLNPASILSGPPALTQNWSLSHRMIQVCYTSPVNRCFAFGRGRNQSLTAIRPTFMAGFMTRRPVRFTGTVRYFMDSSPTPMPGGQTIGDINIQIIFDTHQPRFQAIQVLQDNNPTYTRPGQALTTQIRNFNFLISSNGRLDIRFWFGPDLDIMYEENLLMLPDGTI